jgi:hypothetical protein
MKHTHINNSALSIISAFEYVKHYENELENIESSFIIPPKPGRPGFGKFFIKLVNKRNPNNPDITGTFEKQKIDHAAREKHKYHRKKIKT